MTIEELCALYGRLPQAAALVKSLEEKSKKTLFLKGLVASATPLLFASVYNRLHRTLVFILDDDDDAGYFYHDLTQILGQDRVLFFPSSFKRAVKYGQRDPANEILRTEVLTRLTGVDPATGSQLPQAKADPEMETYIVTYPMALSELVISRTKLNRQVVRLKVGDKLEISDLANQLRTLGFKEQDYVYEPGQFALRGSILDVYSFSCEYPYRIDFFGDEVDTIRTFEVEDQLSKDKKTDIEIVPELAQHESEKMPFLQFLPEDSVLLSKDFTFVRDRIDQIYNEGFSTQALTERLEGVPEQDQKQIMLQMKRENMLCMASQFVADSAKLQCVEFGSEANRQNTVLSFNIEPQPLYHKNFQLLSQSLEDYLLKGYQLYILADSEKQNQRLKEIFAGDELASYHIRFTPVDHTLHEGFVDNDLKLCLFTDHQIFDRFHKYSLRSDSARLGKMALTMKELQEMDIGDYIIHVDFGIGKFGGLVRVPLPPDPRHPERNGKQGYQEMIRIIYRNNDKVDVSIHSLYKISKYRSNDTDQPPQLSTLGTGAWNRLKEKAKKKIKDIARDLIKLYAERRREKGFAFSPDTYMQHELEASFMYEDTPDQYKATQDVKRDMESPRPMDRLVCGDVGFGKTEVAIRASFKAVCDSKQVAVLVPTTILAYQHYQTFMQRLKEMPVRVEYLSRARSGKKTKEILEDLASGKIDILIGTQKLLGKSVKWHDLGLLVIDEEQKFGVSTKEKLRKLKVNVDTLTMSATPIPRTLQFSLMGARDMSIIRTPPPNRYPIHTEVDNFGHEVIADAINFEMSRNGQVFFVSNRISSLPELANLIHKYVPDCRVAIGHGQMPPEQLEKILMGFYQYDYDVLLSTTIVENGIDIPNANTIIINDAHRFGLADLHQMRGRVGRSNKKAFCYLLAPPKSSLTTEARRRLDALENFSELGSGINLAMQDLDIRGAGNLLGAEQSGFMEDLGYETYQKILTQAVTELKNDEFQDLYSEEMQQGQVVTGDDFVDDCAVESDLEMYFPDNYVPGSSERMLLYRELDQIEDDQALEAYRKRLVDRFGPIPHEGEELMRVVRLRWLGKHLGCEKIILKQGNMQLQFVSNEKSPFFQSQTFAAVIKYATTDVKRVKMKEKNGRRLMIISNVPSVEAACSLLEKIGNLK
ncbi:transcription-repair coupling factor [Prevotella cerevisiae]|uniref:Transcription-repair-coupling factor n=1 Tax=Segatella cerevisiae TaxID=2053716 RepID=A0ABT1BV57_9BACT|nr:transcription-repair coupling factor [Segatella cerevisiae]MCO6024956.1 transcription-repair coupling factor [Segatella cerevisiae]